MIYETARRLVKNHFEAEDITQQVFLNLWANPHSFRSGNFAAWLTTVTRNYSISHLRRRQTALLCNAFPEAFLTNAADGVEDEAIKQQTVRYVRIALDHLKPRQREVIVAAFIDGETHERIARRTELPLGTVKTRIRAGLKRMRKQFAEAADRYAV
ncbi:MAG: hypothetical protein NVS9B12_03290 [Vulcanimicrobiaceae bacterium]